MESFAASAVAEVLCISRFALDKVPVESDDASAPPKARYNLHPTIRVECGECPSHCVSREFK